MSLFAVSLRSWPLHCLGVVICLSQMFASNSLEAAEPLFPQNLLCPAPQRSADASPEVADVDTVAPQAIITWMLDENPVRDSALDADGDGNTLMDEKLLALADDEYCVSTSTTCSAADEAALAKAREHLRAFTDQGGGPGYVIEPLNQAGDTLPEGLGPIDLHDLLDPIGRTVQIRCVALPEEVEGEDEPYWQKNGDGGFRLSGDIDNLSKNRGSLGAVKAAELSITSDLIEDQTAYRVNAVAGYAFDVSGGDDIRTSFIPFLEAERVTSGDETQIDTLGAGFQQAATVNWPGMLTSEFAVTPVYNTDSDFESQTGTLKFRWTPSLAPGARFPLGAPQAYGPVELRLGLDLLADAGRVFDEGDQDNLEGEGNFLRLGSQASMQARGAPSNFFRQFELQLANRYLYNVDTAFESINQFDAALAYLFPGNENYQLSFAYSNGRDENSLELYEFWQTQFGIRF